MHKLSVVRLTSSGDLMCSTVVIANNVSYTVSILWPPDAKSRLTRKDPNVGKDWRQTVKRAAEDKMVEWHHQFNRQELGRTPRDGEGQGGPACCRPWGCRVRHNLATKQQLFHIHESCLQSLEALDLECSYHKKEILTT